MKFELKTKSKSKTGPTKMLKSKSGPTIQSEANTGPPLQSESNTRPPPPSESNTGPPPRSKSASLSIEGRYKKYSRPCSWRNYDPLRPNCKCFDVSRVDNAEWLDNVFRQHDIFFDLSSDPERASFLTTWLNQLSSNHLAPIRNIYMRAQGCYCATDNNNWAVVLFRKDKYVADKKFCFGVEKTAEVKTKLEEVITRLPEVDGRSTMTKDALLEMFQAVRKAFEGRRHDRFCVCYGK